MRPLIFLDFDGVINTFPDRKVLRRGGIGHTRWLKPGDPRRDLYDVRRAFRLDGNEQARTSRGRFRVHWSREVVGRLDALDVDIHWLSTWQPYAVSTLDPMLGVNWPTEIWYDPVTDERRWTGKRRTVFDAIRRGDRPIIWVDDEEITWTVRMQVESLRPACPVLMVSPDERIGLSRRQLALIELFAMKPGMFQPVVMDLEPGKVRHVEHLGL